jgi:S-adenosylmethionine-diacylglycerol 3-amino-3-carboxypropyl transferase
MAESEIAGKADFGDIRYAQLWEDADALLVGLSGHGADVGFKQKPDATLVSICSAGDNALAMLLLDPAKVVVVDLSDAQLECLRIRIAAWRRLKHDEFLQLMGSRACSHRDRLLDTVLATMPPASQYFWDSRRDAIVTYGLGGVGKFENYFRVMRRWLLPLVHSRKTIDDVFIRRGPAQRAMFYATRWNSWRWKTLLKVFFSRFTMGRLGRDPAFFEHVDGSVADHVARKIVYAAQDQDPADNPYLHWILKGTHGDALPLPWRKENFEVIRARLDRLELRHGSLETFVATGEKADGFNLSDIFEYMTPAVFAQVYGRVLAAGNPGARLVYWNMMAPRRCPPHYDARIRTRNDVETAGKIIDKAFFYSHFVVEEVA